LTAEAEDTLTNLRHNLDCLKRLLVEAIRLHRPGSVEEATMLADIRDYIMYVALDAVEDPALASTLVDRFTHLQAWLETMHKQTPVWKAEHETIRWYIGWLFALEQLLSLKHKIKRLPGEKISREDFMRSFKRTAVKLGLQP